MSRTHSDMADFEVISSVELGGTIPFAPAIRAGNWFFASGGLAQDYETGIPPQVAQNGAPYRGSHRSEREANFIYDRLEGFLKKAGGSLSDVVRVDQFYNDYRDVDPYHSVRKARLAPHVPPSTSMLCSGLLLPEARAHLDAVAYIDPDFPAEERHRRDRGLDGPATSGFSAALVAGDYVFIPGVTAGAGKDATELHIHKSARVPAGTLWWSQNIILETEFVIQHRIAPALELAGSKLEHVVKAQVYLAHVEDIPGFMRVWRKYFENAPCALTVIPSPNPSIGVSDGRIEVNIVALTSDGATEKRLIDIDVPMPLEATPPAVLAGDMLFMSGLIACDEAGLVEGAVSDPAQPHYRDAVVAEAEEIVARASRICDAAGTDLGRVTRIQQFHTDLSSFHRFAQAWMRALPGQHLPLSAVAQPALPVPHATGMVDLWVHAPA
ncbi:MAG: Rid family hydrolase [Hyphomonadaceae bacterium]|nr:Rid family hydrolase [Hyphomonadaceae bacterium]